MIIDGKLKSGTRTSVSIDDVMVRFLEAAGCEARAFIREKMKECNSYKSKDARMDILFEIASDKVLNGLKSSDKQREIEL